MADVEVQQRATVTVVWAFTYSQLAATITKWLPDAHAWMLGSTNRCSVRSIPISSLACCERGRGVPATRPLTSR